MKRELIEQRRLIELVPKEKLIKMLSLLYTYNHGDKVCYPLEYVKKKGSVKGDSLLEYGGAYESFVEELNNLGYFMMKVVFEDYRNKSRKEQKEFRKRVNMDLFMPKDVKKFIIMDNEYNVVSLFETPATLAFLAKNGDERAKETFNRFKDCVKVESEKSLIKKIRP